MQLNAPKQLTWIIALVIGILGILGHLVTTLPLIGGVLGFWLVAIALVLLLVATMVKGL